MNRMQYIKQALTDLWNWDRGATSERATRAMATHAKGTQPSGLGQVQERTANVVIRELNGQLVPYADNKVSYVRNAYDLNDIIYGCAKLIVDKAIIAPWDEYTIEDEQELKNMQAYRKQLGVPGMLTKFKNAKHKALKPVKGSTRLKELLLNPNEEDTLSKHHSGLWTYKLVTGDYYEKWTYADGGPNEGQPIAWDTLPSQFMEIVSSMTIPARAIAYKLLESVNIPYEANEILHEYYFNPDWTYDGQQLYGMSPLKALLRRIQRNNESQKSGVAAFQNGGVRGVGWLDMNEEITRQDADGSFTVAQASEVKLKYEEMTRGGSARAGSTIMSGYKVGFTPFGLSPIDLDQIVTEKWDMRMIAALAYGIPSQLLNDPDNKTYANQAEGEKALTTRCAVPLLSDREASLNRKLRKSAMFKKANTVVSYDMTVYAELEGNKKEQADYLNTAWWYTPNQKRQIMGEPLSDNPIMDQFIVPSGLMLLDDVAAPPDNTPVDTTGKEEEINFDYIE